jgi:hypothetical protein
MATSIAKKFSKIREEHGIGIETSDRRLLIFQEKMSVRKKETKQISKVQVRLHGHSGQ